MSDPQTPTPEANPEVHEAAASTDSQANRPALRIVKGDLTAEEVAALVAVLSAAGSSEVEESAPFSAWSAPSVTHRAALPAGSPNGWLLSGR